MTAASEVAALQTVLAAEHAVVYGYGVAGAHLVGAEQSRATRGWERHRSDRDAVEAVIAARSATPEPPRAAYALPFPVTNAREARSLLALLEDRLAAVWADAVAALNGELRTTAADGLTEAALAALAWGAETVAFPGLPER